MTGVLRDPHLKPEKKGEDLDDVIGEPRNWNVDSWEGLGSLPLRVDGAVGMKFSVEPQ